MNSEQKNFILPFYFERFSMKRVVRLLQIQEGKTVYTRGTWLLEPLINCTFVRK